MRGLFVRRRKAGNGERGTISAGIALNTNRADRKNPASRGSLRRFGLIGAEAADREPRTGGRMTVQQCRGKTQFPSDGSNLVFVERRERLHYPSFVDQLLNS